MTRGLALAVGLGVAVLGLLPGTAAACTCAVQSQAEHLRRADAVFTGRVIRVEDPRGNQRVLSSADPIVATVAVEDVAKGRAVDGPFRAGLCGGSNQLPDNVQKPDAVAGAHRVRVATARSGASCGLAFQRGQTWEIYAQRARPGTVPAAAQAPRDPGGADDESFVVAALVAVIAAGLLAWSAPSSHGGVVAPNNRCRAAANPRAAPFAEAIAERLHSGKSPDERQKESQ